MQKNIDFFFDNFIYKTDKEQFGVNEYWEEPTLNSAGKYVCDCESVAIWLKRNINEFNDWDYYWCRLNGEGHCILSNGKDMIDNNVQKVIPLDSFINDYPWEVTELRPYKWYELLWKFTQAKFYKIWFKIIGK